jgi:hypothetical protein
MTRYIGIPVAIALVIGINLPYILAYCLGRLIDAIAGY